MSLAFRYICYLLFVAITLSACSTKTERHTQSDNVLTRNPAFAAFVTSYTGGLIKRKEPIIITLANEIADSSLWNKEADANLLEVKPKLAGKLTWQDGRTLTFSPAEPIPAGTTYEAELNLGKLYDIPDQDLRTFKFGFETRKLALNYDLEDVLTPAGTNEGQFIGLVKTNDFIEPAALEQVFGFDYIGTKVSVSWLHSDDGLTHRFTSNGLALRSDGGKLVINADGKSIGSDDKDSKDYTLPAPGSFQIWRVERISQPDLAIRLHYTQALKPGQDLESLVRVGTEQEVQVLQDENTLTIFQNQNEVPEVSIESGLLSASGVHALAYRQGQMNIPNPQPELSLVNTGYISPGVEGKTIVNFRSMGINTVRVDVTAIAPDDINQIMLHEMQRDYDNGTSDQHRLYQDPIRKYGKPVHSRLLNLTGAKTLNGGHETTYQLDLSDVTAKYPDHLFHVWIRGEERISTNQTPSTELVWANARYEEDESRGVFDDGLAMIRHYWRELMVEDAMLENVKDYVGSNPYEFGATESYYWEEGTNQRLKAATMLLNSNLGLIAKQGFLGKVHITATSLLMPGAASGAEISFYDRRLKLISTAKTDGDGLVTYDGVQQPALVVGRWEKSVTWLPIKDDYMLETSHLDVRGDGGAAINGEGIKAMIYTDRGLYRPGDTIYATLLVQEPAQLQAKAKPVILTINDDKGRLLDRKVKAFGTDGFYTFKLSTPVTQTSGTYYLKGYYAGLSYSKSILIGNKEANRMNISTRFVEEPVKAGVPNVANIQANFLFGAPAADALVRVTAVAKPKIFSPSAPELKDYSFEPLGWNGANGPETELLSTSLNAQGTAAVPFTYVPQPSLKGVLELAIKTTVTEQSGQASEDNRTAFCHVLPYYLGARAIGNSSYDKSRPSTFKIMAALVTPTQQYVTDRAEKIIAQLYRRQSDVWYEVNNGGGVAYHNEPMAGFVAEYELKAKGNVFSIDGIINEESISDYFLLIKEPITKQEVRIEFMYESQSPANPDQRSLNPTELDLAKPQEAVKVGSKWELALPGEKGTKFLVSIENGMDVLEQSWTLAENDHTILPLTIKPEWAPNVFVHVTALRPYVSKDNLQPIRKYGIVNLKVIDPASHLEPQLVLPKQVKPLEQLEVKVSEKNGKEMTYTLAIVDEGLLNMTRFKTPDPHERFFTPAGLGVRTYDMYGDVMIGEGVDKLQHVLQAGGDEFANADAALKNQRFKPVVRFIGPFKLGSGDDAIHKIDIPNYFGQVRVMVVAGNGAAYGSADGFVTVKSDLMASLFGPKAAGPAEQLQIPLTLFIENPSLTKAQVTITSAGALKQGAATTITVPLQGRGEQVVMIPVTTGNTGGQMGVLTATVTATGVRSLATVKIPVRQPNISQYKLLDYVIGTGQKQQATLPNLGLGAKAEVLVSSSPRVVWDRVYDRVAVYPHGLSDQAAGLGYAQALLLKSGQIKDVYKQNVLRNNIGATIIYLQKFAQNDGLICYHPNDRNTALWPSLLTYLFLSEAENSGFDAYRYRTDMEGPLFKMIGTYGNGNDAALRQAYQGLACLGGADGSEINKLLEGGPQSRLGASLQVLVANVAKARQNSYDEIKYPKQRPNLSTLPIFAGLDGLMSNSLEAEALLGQRKVDEAMPLVRDVASLLNADLYLEGYQEAFLIRAAMAWNRSQGAPKPLQFVTKINTAERSIKSLDPSFSWAVPIGNGPATWSLSNGGSKPIAAQIMLTGIPAIGTEKAQSDGIALTYQLLSQDGQAVNPNALEAGKVVKLQVTVRNLLTSSKPQNIKGQLLLPTGFEVADQLPAQQGTEVENRGDRLAFSSSIVGGQSRMFEVLMTPRFVGTVRLPALSARAWQGQYYQASTGAQSLKVVVASTVAQ